MESWKIRELDELSPGDVALKIFQAQKEADQAASARAAAARKWSEIKNMLEKAESAYSEAQINENDCIQELKELKHYLEKRLASTE